MAFFSFLKGLLTTEVNSANIKDLFGSLIDRMGMRRKISLDVEANGKVLRVKAFNRKELEFCIKQAENFINARTQKFNVGARYGVGNDRVSEVDQLGFEHYISAFVDLIESSYTKPPLTIGILGSWGMGKSFLLEHIGRQLRKRHQRRREGDLITLAPRVHIVDFNAWEYSSAELIWPSLVRKIMDQLETEVSWRFPGRFLTKFGRNLKQQLKKSQGQLIVITLILI